jgi:hypothetical protein
MANDGKSGESGRKSNDRLENNSGNKKIKKSRQRLKTAFLRLYARYPIGDITYRLYGHFRSADTLVS